VTRAVKVLSDAGKWDDAFALLHKHERPDLIQLLLKRGMLSILEHGRLVTLRDWLRFVGGRHAVTPYVLLAQAELAFRSGSYERAGRLAYRAATELDATDPLKSTAYYRAGQSCSLMDRAAEALELFVSARKNAHSHRDSRNALWGEFSVLVELEQPTAEERLNELENTAPNDPDTSVRWASGLVVLGVRTGGVENAVDRASDVLSMLDDVRDPSVRSSFWHVFAAALVLNARYEEALEAVTSALQEVEAFQIHFALPYILFNRATACIGLRRFDEAEQTIGEVARHARENLDGGHILANAGMLHGRLLLQTGSADAAAVATSTPIAHPISKSMKAEYLLTHALALACSGKAKAAARMVESVRSLSGYLEPQLLASWATALCALHLDDPAAGDQIRLAYEQSVNSGAFDLVVFAYRLDPVVLPILAADKINRSLLAQIVVAAQDHSLARAADLELPPPPAGGVADLTARESQVYRLLGEGLTNREIAETLVISEPTAKVHVSNVLQKLGVRSRTQAAIIAARTGFPGGEKA
jgi:ATP/maltotriose-dependent transcriptional regulator MalT